MNLLRFTESVPENHHHDIPFGICTINDLPTIKPFPLSALIIKIQIDNIKPTISLAKSQL